MTDEPSNSAFDDTSAGASSSTLTEEKEHNDIAHSLEAMLYAELSPAITKKVVFANRAASSDDILTSDYPMKTSHYDRLMPQQRIWSSAEVLDQPRSILAGRAGRYAQQHQSVSKATQLWRELVLHLHQEIVAKEKYPLMTFRYYDDCFFGSELVDCMVPFLRRHCSNQGISRGHILTVCHRLLLSGVMINVQVPSNTVFQELSLYRFPNRPSWTDTESKSEDSCTNMESKCITSRLKCMFNMVKSWKKLVHLTKPDSSTMEVPHQKSTSMREAVPPPPPQLQSSRVVPIPQRVLPGRSFEPVNFGSELSQQNTSTRARIHSSPQIQRNSPVQPKHMWRSSSCSSLDTVSRAANKHANTPDWKIYGYV